MRTRWITGLYVLLFMATCSLGLTAATDTAAPNVEVKLASSTGTDILKDSLARFAFYVTDNSLRKFTISVPGSTLVAGPFAPGTKWMRGSTYWSTKGSKPGEYECRWTAQDHAGNERSGSMKVNLLP